MRKILDFTAYLLKEVLNGWAKLPFRRKCIIITAVVSMIIITLVVDVPNIGTLRNWADTTGEWFVVVFIIGYIVLTQFPLPRTILTLSSGLLFGPWRGVAVSLMATTISAVVAISVVRYLARDWVAPRLNASVVNRINARLEARGWLAIMSLRMIAAVPFSILNYAAALTPVRLLPFSIATAVGSAPGTIITVLLGNSLASGNDPLMVVFSIGLACLGIAGLILDNKLPVKA